MPADELDRERVRDRDRDTVRDRDLVLAPNEQAAILDETKGMVSVYVGPNKTSLANSDRPVYFDPQEKRFVRCTLDRSVSTWPYAQEGSYIVLENPAGSGQQDDHPRSGSSSQTVRLDFGKRINIHGPATFPLWPGQSAEVIRGHRLRSNEYLLVEVYNEEAAKANWGQSVMKRQTRTEPRTETTNEEIPQTTVTPDVVVAELTMGQRLIVPGTQVSFYMPPTGVSVVRDERLNYVRQAITLERLEYCILLNENGNKRYVYGPAVVFPEPEETFVEDDGENKFRAIELNPISAIHIKVIANYSENGNDYKLGDELFITGTEQPIYYPRQEHAIIKYGERDTHHAVAIPEGEGRYVLNRLTGEITLVGGPKMLLPDPRDQVIVRRVLTDKEVSLWFPGNAEALEYNSRLAALSESREFVTEKEVASRGSAANYLSEDTVRTRGAAPKRFVGEEMTRQTTYTPPRTVTLNTKYEGAVTINVWPEYAVMVLDKSGNRKVVIGPETILLEYDETLMSMELSTGTPKTDDRTIRIPYLLTRNNRVSDVVEAETRDLTRVRLLLSYRVNFEGEDREQWFSADNYVKLLTEHMRSLLRGVVKQHGIREFYQDSVNVIRDAVLGRPREGEGRPGRAFAENGMRIYDVEVLAVTISDRDISMLLQDSQRTAVQQALELTRQEMERDNTIRTEEIRRELATARAQTNAKDMELKVEFAKQRLAVVVAELAIESEQAKQQLDSQLVRETVLSQISQAELERDRARTDQELAFAKQELEQRIEELRAEVQGVVDKANAVSPQLIAALEAFGNKELMSKMAELMAPLAIIDRTSLNDVLAKLFAGTHFETMMNGLRPFSPALVETASTEN